MLNRNEIASYYDEFLERLSINREKGSVAFSTDDRVYEFDDCAELIDDYGKEACEVFLDQE